MFLGTWAHRGARPPEVGTGACRGQRDLEHFTHVLGQPYVSIPCPTASLYNNASINETSGNEIPLQ